MKLSTSSSIFFASLALSSSSSTLAAPARDATESGLSVSPSTHDLFDSAHPAPHCSAHRTQPKPTPVSAGPIAARSIRKFIYFTHFSNVLTPHSCSPTPLVHTDLLNSGSRTYSRTYSRSCPQRSYCHRAKFGRERCFSSRESDQPARYDGSPGCDSRSYSGTQQYRIEASCVLSAYECRQRPPDTTCSERLRSCGSRCCLFRPWQRLRHLVRPSILFPFYGCQRCAVVFIEIAFRPSILYPFYGRQRCAVVFVEIPLRDTSLRCSSKSSQPLSPCSSPCLNDQKKFCCHALYLSCIESSHPFYIFV